MDTTPPPIPEGFEEGLLALDHGHHMYWRRHGNRAGPVVLVLHGGPGGQHNPRAAEFFDPRIWCVVLYDQRGCGRSTPRASTEHNTVVHLVADIECLRVHLGVERWALFGGSWGTRLAISYGVVEPRRCTGFMLRGVFLGRARDIDWFLWDVRRLFPESHARFLDDIEAACGRRPRNVGELLSLAGEVLRDDHPRREDLALAWDDYEYRMASVAGMPAPPQTPGEAADHRARALTIAVLEHHYMADVLPGEPEVLDQLAAITHLPCEIVHGRYDAICLYEQAHDLARAWPAAVLTAAEQSGHWTFAPQMAQLLHGASARLLARIREAG